MTLNGRKKIARTFHFDRGGSIGEFTSATNANGAVSYTANVTRACSYRSPIQVIVRLSTSMANCSSDR